MRRIRMPFIAIITLVVLTTIVLAPFMVSGAGYLINVLVVESNSTSYTNLPIIAVINNSYLSTNGYMTSTGLDTRIFNAANTTLKHMVADNKTLFVDNITASSTASFEYKSGYSALSSFPIIVGQGGYVTTADNASLEPLDNFSLTIDTKIPTVGTGDIFNKQDALRLSYSDSNLTLSVGNYSSPTMSLQATGISAGEHTIIISTATSGDWARYAGNPILTPGVAGSWDDMGVVAKTVIKVGSTYYMYYLGDSGGYNVQIGVATSPDLVTWTKSPSNPIITKGAPATWEAAWVGMPSVYYRGTNDWVMLYEGNDGTNSKIGLATSTNGITWTKYGSNPVLNLGTPGAWDDAYVGTPSIVPSTIGGVYNVYYVGAQSPPSDQTGLAYTSDFISFTKEVTNPIFPLGSGSDFDSSKSATTDCLIYESNYLAMINGYNGTNWSIGYATSANGLSFTKYWGNPIFQHSTGWESNSVKLPLIYPTDSLNYMFYSGTNATNTTTLAYTQYYQVGLATSTELGLTGQLQLWVDGIVVDSLTMNASIPDNSNNWVWYINPYINYIKLDTSG